VTSRVDGTHRGYHDPSDLAEARVKADFSVDEVEEEEGRAWPTHQIQIECEKVWIRNGTQPSSWLYTAYSPVQTQRWPEIASCVRHDITQFVPRVTFAPVDNLC
jgi:hypothetical protein